MLFSILFQSSGNSQILYLYLLGCNSMKKWKYNINIIKNLRIDIQVYVDKPFVQK